MAAHTPLALVLLFLDPFLYASSARVATKAGLRGGRISDIFGLENLRFRPGNERNCATFAQKEKASKFKRYMRGADGATSIVRSQRMMGLTHIKPHAQNVEDVGAGNVETGKVIPNFSPEFREELDKLFQWRRDVRRFVRDPVDPLVLRQILYHGTIAPSVGNSQPWRFVQVESDERRQMIVDNYKRANAEALEIYEGKKKSKYAQLKLSGLEEAPIILAVFCEKESAAGHGLGRQTMPESLEYSVVSAINNMWLSARAHGVGLGWVSILQDQEHFHEMLDVPDTWKLVAVLCIGYPEEDHIEPELVRYGWQDRLDNSTFFFKR